MPSLYENQPFYLRGLGRVEFELAVAQGCGLRTTSNTSVWWRRRIHELQKVAEVMAWRMLGNLREDPVPIKWKKYWRFPWGGDPRESPGRRWQGSFQVSLHL